MEDSQENKLTGNIEQGSGSLQARDKTNKEKENFVESNSKMDIDQPNTSTSKGQESSPTQTTSQNPKTNQENSDSRANFELLSDDEIEKADKDQLIDLARRIKEELEIRKQLEANSSSGFQTSNYRISNQELESKLQKSESALNSFQTSSPNTDKKADDKNNAGIVVGTIAVVGALAIGSVALVKSKFGSKSKKK